MSPPIRVRELYSRKIVGGQIMNLVLHVETLQDGETVFSHFVNNQQAILLAHADRCVDTERGPLDPPLRRVLIVDARHAEQTTVQALADLARVLRQPGTYYHPDSRGLWDEVRFLEGDDADPHFTAPVQVP